MLSSLAHLLNVDPITPARCQYFPMCRIRLLPKFSSDLDTQRTLAPLIPALIPCYGNGHRFFSVVQRWFRCEIVFDGVGSLLVTIRRDIAKSFFPYAAARAPLNARLQAPARALAAPDVPEVPLALHSVSHGTLPLLDEPPADSDAPDSLNNSPLQISYSGLSSATSAPSVIASTQFAAGTSSSGLTLTAAQQRTILQQLAKKHVLDGILLDHFLYYSCADPHNNYEIRDWADIEKEYKLLVHQI
ncbi:hypothetical protein B0H11DRAFT_2203402 [Mycena galericulata]|nr:hypothetical protein B0H11DRAFT_2203402 [Mycena galericulata]